MIPGEIVAIIVLGGIIGGVLGFLIARIYFKRKNKKIEMGAIEKIKEQGNKTIFFKDTKVNPKEFYIDGKKVDLVGDINKDIKRLHVKKVMKDYEGVVDKKIKKKKEVKKPIKRRSKK